MATPELIFHLRAMTRAIYFVTDEEDRFLVKLTDVLKKYAERAWVFNAALGLLPIKALIRDWTSRAHAADGDTMSIHETLIRIYKDDPKESQHFYVITDPERWLNDPHVVRRVLNIMHQGHQDNKTIKTLIFVGSRKVIPEKLSRYIEVIHDTGLQADEIQRIVAEAASNLKTAVPKDAATIFKGLTSYETLMAISQSVIATKNDAVDPKRIDPGLIADFRRRQIKKTDLVQYVDTDAVNFNQVGGAARFKAWAVKTRACWSPEGRAFGLKPPKGVLCVGVWGCGKSLSVKAMGAAWGLPVVSLEMGRLRSSGVGESEANVYRAIRIIEAAAPCVTGETEVTLGDGTTRPIKSLWDDYVSGAASPLRVQCWNETALKVEVTNVRGITCRRAEAFRVEAANGFYLNATANHQHYVMRGGMPEWVRTDDLQVGDMLAVPTARYAGHSDTVAFHPPGMRTLTRSDGTTEFRRGGGGFRDAAVARLPLEWTTDLGWLLGVIEGDGFIGAHDGIGLTNTDPALLANFERIMLAAFGLTPVRREHKAGATPNLPGLNPDSVFKPCWTTVVTNQLAADFLRSARENILAAPLQVRAAFLAGWVDADGCVGTNKISLTVKHPQKWAQRQLLGRQLVQSLGVVPSKFDFPSMEVTGSRAVALARVLAEHLVQKRPQAARVASSENGFDRGMGFACGALLEKARRDSGVLHTDLQRHFSASALWGHEKGRVNVSARHMDKYVEVLGEHASDLKRVRDAECRWVEVRSIDSVGETDVFDLVCEGEDTHSFFANGLVTHNCIVWIDEAEKSLSGGASSNQSDAGTTSRTIGILSTWLQETNAPVCLAMTANSLKTLPVEFVNRMDERFFFDMPSEEDRVDILKIHLEKAGQNPDSFDLARLAEASRLMVGREMEQAIGAAMIESFSAKKAGLDEDLLAIELSKKPRIVKTMVDEVREVLEWVGYDPEADDGVRARFAGKPTGNGGTLKLISGDG